MRWLLWMLAVTALSLVVFGCGPAEKQDAPHAAGATVNRSRPDFVIAMPDNYRNVVAKCDGHGHRVYVTSHGADEPSAIAVVEDQTCDRAP